MEIKNMKAAIYARVASIEQVDPGLKSQLILCGAGYFCKENSAPANEQEAPSQSEGSMV